MTEIATVAEMRDRLDYLPMSTPLQPAESQSPIRPPVGERVHEFIKVQLAAWAASSNIHLPAWDITNATVPTEEEIPQAGCYVGAREGIENALPTHDKEFYISDEVLEYDIVIRMSPRETYTLDAEVRSTDKGKFRFIEPVWA